MFVHSILFCHFLSVTIQISHKPRNISYMSVVIISYILSKEVNMNLLVYLSVYFSTNPLSHD